MNLEHVGLPFTIQQFLQLFKVYNETIFPLQILFYVLAGTIVYLSLKKIIWSDIIINSIFSFFWLWMGIVYHLLFFSKINKAAYLFSGLFIVQGILFWYFGVITKRLTYRFKFAVPETIGAVLILFALAIYPLLGYFLGHIYPMAPSFGLPCPTTIFTLGALLWIETGIPPPILIVPISWSVIGFSAALQLDMKEDISILIAALITSIGLLMKKKHGRPVPTDSHA